MNIHQKFESGTLLQASYSFLVSSSHTLHFELLKPMPHDYISNIYQNVAFLLSPPPPNKKSDVSNVSGKEKAVNAENKNTQFIKMIKIHINESMT